MVKKGKPKSEVAIRTGSLSDFFKISTSLVCPAVQAVNWFWNRLVIKGIWGGDDSWVRHVKQRLIVMAWHPQIWLAFFDIQRILLKR